MKTIIYKIILIALLFLNGSAVGFSQVMDGSLGEEEPRSLLLKEKTEQRELKEEPEISLKMKVLQIVLNEEHLMGVDWEAIVSDYQKAILSLKEIEENRGTMNEILNLGTLSHEDYQVLLEALDTVGEIYVIQETKNIIKNQHNITLLIETIFSHLLKKEEPRYSRDTIRLDVSAQIKDSQGIQLNIAYHLDNPQQTAKASVFVQNGSTVVLGGVFKEARVSFIKKFPLLGDIPFLGVAFRNQRERQHKTEIIIFLTPKIITE